MPLYPRSWFREARPASAAWNLAKTYAQASLFWSTFLWAVPVGIQRLELKLALPQFTFPGQPAVGWALFALASGLSLWSAWTMAVRGEGTPLPLDLPRKLVVTGAYRWIRNPMAVFGLSQAAAVGVLLGSPATLLYAVMGGLVWHFGPRVTEEEDLVQRFGEDYERYRAAVRCWVPRLRPYQG